jgi:hypothetical protein
MRGDHGMHGGGPGMGIGIGIGIGVVQQMMRDQGNNPDTRSSTKSTTKKSKAAKKEDKNQAKQKQTTDIPAKKPDDKPPQTANKPPPTNTTDKPPTQQTTDEQPPATPPSTTDNPPGPSNPTASANPPGSTPPQPVAPPDQTTNKEDCPQRGKGCVALIIDFLSYIPLKSNYDQTVTHLVGGDMKMLAEHLSANNHCDVDWVTPKYDLPPPITTSDSEDPDKHLSETLVNQQYTAKNNAELKAMHDAIERHREKVKGGVETAIEIVFGHGSEGEWAHHCGAIGAAETSGSLDRQRFHKGNYDAVKRNACSWIVADFSCASGLTPFVIDELNNQGLPIRIEHDVNPDGSKEEVWRSQGCTATGFQNVCSNHAAYELDVAYGAAEMEEKVCAILNPKRVLEFNKMIPYVGNSFRFSPASWAGSSYQDHGYHYCDPVDRQGYKAQRYEAIKDRGLPPYTKASDTSAVQKDWEEQEERRRYEKMHEPPVPDSPGSPRGTTK